jgi:hypothetical protein
VIVRWGLDQLDGLLAELGIQRPFVVSSDRWSELPLPGASRWSEVPTDRIPTSRGLGGADGLLAVGGGSAIDLPRRFAETGLPAGLGADDVLGLGVDGVLRRPRPDRRMKGGGAGAHLAGSSTSLG